MTLLKRTFTTLTAKIDSLVGEIENHDALIQAAIREQKKKIAAARIQLRRAQTNELRLQGELKQLEANEKRWAQRAVKDAETNEGQALDCLQRRQTIRTKMARLRSTQQEYIRCVEKMKANIVKCEEDLSGMVQKHQMLRARQSTADAMQMIDRDGGAELDNIADSFDRWEVKIAQGEYTIDECGEIDELEREYLSEENENQLRSELAELLRDEKMTRGNE